MKNMESFKKFVKEYKTQLKIAGYSTLVITMICSTLYMMMRVYIRGTVMGCNYGWTEAIKWCNEKFPDTNLQELYEAYRLAHPEEWSS